MFEAPLPPDRGLLLVQPRESRLDSAVHMLWMRFDLAIIWLNSDRIVVDVRPAKRWQPMIAPRTAARYILETHIDNLDHYAIGDQLFLEENFSA